MSGTLSRRRWLKTGLTLAGSLPFGNSLLAEISHSPASGQPITFQPTDAEFIAGAPPELKARLFANENPFGPSPKAKQAIVDAMNTSYQYAFARARVLTQKIADFEGLKPSNFLLGAGSSPLIAATAMYFSKPGTNVISGDPSYHDLPGKAESFSAKWIKVPLTPDYKLDLDAMEKAIDSSTIIVYICNPNNPTGTVLDNTKLREFCKRVSAKVPVFIDEAYIDYLPDPKATTVMDLVKDGHNIIVARTFSKLYGFAGLRVGYIAGQPELMRQLSKFTEGDGSVSATSIEAAIATYQEKDFLQEALKKTIASKEYLYGVLKAEGYSYIPSSANFVMFPLKMEGRKFVEEMNKRGVGIRSWRFNNKDWCRISIGRMDEMEAFAAAFKEIS
jgi:histidinol-phosphate aminotransferase